MKKDQESVGRGKYYIMISCFDNSVIDLFMVKHLEIVKLFMDAQVYLYCLIADARRHYKTREARTSY